MERGSIGTSGRGLMKDPHGIGAMTRLRTRGERSTFSRNRRDQQGTLLDHAPNKRDATAPSASAPNSYPTGPSIVEPSCVTYSMKIAGGVKMDSPNSLKAP
ncbi:hypothetical protein Nepgr_026324 [Nepenthes gracilis]|uniref:Uncharacterized protein n=1 Tax=Nepenthes gracilis TaxID=150966 RepID=A0AAD3Y2D0_NEPGR|nr:hypothetical protein Nepgr_026324 [Nepenthes gracilis]